MQFFYHWRGPGIFIAEAIGLVWLALGFVFGIFPKNFWLMPFAVSLVSYLFLRICALIHWYKGFPRHAGIGLQFQKGMVAASYFLVLLAFANWFQINWLFIVLMILFIVVAHVNIYLLAIYFKDKDRNIPQMYSSIS